MVAHQEKETIESLSAKEKAHGSVAVKEGSPFGKNGSSSSTTTGMRSKPTPPASPPPLQTASSSGTIPVTMTQLQRQDRHIPVQYPGAVRMLGVTNDPRTADDDEPTVVVYDDDEEAPPPAAAQSELIEAELVSEPLQIDNNNSHNTDIEESKTGDGEIMSASPLQDKQLILHFARQRRVQVVVALLLICIAGLVVGMIVGLSREQEGNKSAVLVFENGTQVAITDDTVEQSVDDDEVDDDDKGD